MNQNARLAGVVRAVDGQAEIGGSGIVRVDNPNESARYMTGNKEEDRWPKQLTLH